MSTPEPPHDEQLTPSESSPETGPPPLPPPDDWVVTKASPIAAIMLGLAFGAGVLLKQIQDVPVGVIALISLLFGARFGATFRR